ncbi:hypothetical protein [Photobacterium kagoshimensis]|uniref:hypothetical protein n=1 Tax=Photobacterium kagoshimensis TaxID=2910242 RepID=UPI003D11D551
MSDIQKRLNDVLYRRHQNGLQVVFAENKKSVKHINIEMKTGGWEPVELFIGELKSELTILNISDFETHL